MKIALNSLLAIASLVLIYLLVETIRKPIHFKDTREFREEQVRAKLKQTADLQKVYKSLKDKYAVSFDSLKYGLMTDTFLLDQVIGDRYDTNQVVTTVQVKLPAKDSLLNIIKNSPQADMTIDQFFEYLSIIPFSGNKKFTLETGEAIVEGTDSMMTSTFQLSTKIGNYMEEFDSAGHVIYDPEYNPSALRKVGDLYKPSTDGNW